MGHPVFSSERIAKNKKSLAKSVFFFMGGGGIWLQCVVRQQCLQQKYDVCSGILQVQWIALGY
jgi:hypothetical protein